MSYHRVIGYHGTSSDRAAIIQGKGFAAKPRPGSWLGTGQYFFYQAKGHAEDWARRVAQRPLPQAAGGYPVVLECEIDLTDCINLLDREHWPLLRLTAQTVVSTPSQLGPAGMFQTPPPKALGYNVDDNTVMNAYINALRQRMPVSCVIAAFMEGRPIFSNSWLYDQSHVCISVLERRAVTVRSMQQV